MGLLDNQSQYQYYNNSENYGNYQFITLDNIISGFMISYVGESKIITKASRTDIQFFAMRAIQELSYDVFRSVKSQEIEVPPSLKMVVPQDYVNYVKLVRVGTDGVERTLYPTRRTSNPFAIKQDGNGNYFFNDNSGDLMSQEGDSNTLSNYKSQVPVDAYREDSTDVEIDDRGRRYGLEPEQAHVNGSFYIDRNTGFIHFGSALSGETIILKYISDGLGSDSEMVVHKFAEEAIYKWIAHGILSTRSNIPEYIVARFKKERFAETRKAKIRLSNIKMEEFTQVLKGMGKQIK